MGIHPWWSGFGQAVASADDLTSAPAREFASAIAAGTLPGAALTGLMEGAAAGHSGVALEIEVERPQDLAYPIRAIEPIAVVFAAESTPPRVLALRDDFPDTPHQNWTPQDAPCSLCIDDRPWAEARLTYRPADLVRRIQLWLAKAARGDLHDTAQPPDPLFFASQLAIVVPRSASQPAENPVELIGFVRPDNPALIITRTVADMAPQFQGLPGFVVIAFRARPQSMTRFRHAPVTLTALHAELQQAGIDLNDEIRTCLRASAGIDDDSVRRLSSRLAIVVAFPVMTPDGGSTDHLRAFISIETAGQVGIKWGLLVEAKTPAGGANGGFVRAIPESTPVAGDIKIEPAQVHLAFDRELATAVAGNAAPDRRRAVLAGGGALGSHIAIDLAREGRFSWTVIDNEYLLPHNLARHALLADDLGAPKALALARQMGWLLNETFAAVGGDVTKHDAELARVFAEADVIIDASASVAVSRHLADLPDSHGRRLCVFFNPAGTSVVLLVEDSDRSVTLRELEAQYHRLVQADPALEDHLRAVSGVRYSGSCRALTNRIPATSAALLSALGARGIVQALKSEEAAVRIWKVADSGAVQLIERCAAATHRLTLGDWSITYDDDLLLELARLRDSRLPRETGGVLLGIADMSRKSVHVAHALPEPEDSRGSPEGFERGIVGLKAAVNHAVEASLHQLTYVGEWHSHPRQSSPLPSAIDLAQIVWLGRELEHEGLPGLMAIAADHGAFAFVLSGASSPVPKNGGAHQAAPEQGAG
jgi:hypothetical protein